MIALFTDFGWRGPYVGQMHAVFARAPQPTPVIDLMHDVPRWNARAAGHLLAAIAASLPTGTVFAAVVDPGVGSERRPLVVQADRQWFVGPDNGLLDVVSARAQRVRWWEITQAVTAASATFHGRDLFAPVAAAIARGEGIPGRLVPTGYSASAGEDLAEVIYVDGFGNAVTGLRGPAHTRGLLSAAGATFRGARIFADVPAGEAVWLTNSMGLVEIAVNQGNAAERFSLDIGRSVHWYGKG